MKLPLIILVLVTAIYSAQGLAKNNAQHYATFGAGGQSCNLYKEARQNGGVQEDMFIDWLIGYLSAFNLIVPNTYDILGKKSFPEAIKWLDAHCAKYPRETFVNATARLTEVLYPQRKQTLPVTWK